MKTIKRTNGAYWTGNSEYGTQWKVYSSNVSQEEIEKDFDIHGMYLGPGSWYTENVTILRGKFRTLVRQVHAIDI